jgi:predicted transcriptional regulator
MNGTQAMQEPLEQALSRRERQIMDAILRLGDATAADIRKNIPDPPSYSAVRRMLTILEEKGYLTHRWEGPRYVYSAAIDVEKARREALERLTDTFFDGSPVKAVATLIDRSAAELTSEELDALAALIERARKEDR